MTSMRSAVPPFVAHALAPFSTHSFPSRAARVRSAAASEPDSGSESANPTRTSPRAIGRSQRSCCARVPWRTSIVVGIALWIDSETAMLASAAAISSSASRYVTESSPIPSNSSGEHMPRKPSWPSSSITSRAKCPVRSHSTANGSILVRANSRASSTIWRCVSERPAGSIAIDIEPSPTLPPQPASGHHLPEQRRGTVLVVPEIPLQHLEDREAHVEPDQVRQRQRPERVVHAELHHRVHGFGRRHAFHDAEHRLVDHRHEHAIRHEPGRILHYHRNLLQSLDNLYDLANGLFPRLESPDHLHQRHDRNRIHEVHPDYLRRSLGLGGDWGDRNGGVVAGEYRPRRRHAIEVAEELELDVGRFGLRFNRELRVAC